MKAIEDMSKQEVIEAIDRIDEEARSSGGFLDQVDRETYEDLTYALLHNYPHLIN